MPNVPDQRDVRDRILSWTIETAQGPLTVLIMETRGGA
jgi:hypothetical protein